ncbi:alpha-hydroxy acid oxidase [Acerihabitans arboris]|uniref:Alpha-hydroxy-acid oxidizing protein n=1 Tax=Acerihabitans arboris TaxID=2691583 RepID=A0A845SFC9_9GAMM|nr:alpha-hydroxy acid oxidase [Acerihabitans arboris]NDL61644.1 alpha-hydroxy-acid oxidizing protein [Acerihabitans arboris]
MMLNLEDYRRMAQRALPAFAFDYVDGGADDERTLADNRAVFDRWQFVAPVLKDASVRDLSVTLGDTTLAAPFMIAPTGYNGMLRYRADQMLAQAAGHAGISYIQSTVSTASLEDMPAGRKGAHWFQLYVLKDRRVTVDLLRRAREVGCASLVVSVDAVHFGNRERDKRHYRKPMKLSLGSYLNVARHPGWVLRTLVPGGMPGFGNLKPYLPPQFRRGVGGATYFAQQMDDTLDWQTLAWIRSLWQGGFYVKGILTVEDARAAMAMGADGLILSNHGGRQLDGSVSPLTVLPDIRLACGPAARILIDGGIRRGTDIVKALALGANAVLVGRPMLYAVAVAGEAGVAQAITLLTQEIDRTLAQLGCRSPAELGPHLLRRRES